MDPLISTLIVFATISLLCHGIQSDDPVFYYKICGNITFTANGTYQVNLEKLLSTLSANATANKNGFFNFSVSHDSTTVYGQYLCRGDLTVDDCSDCVSYAAKDIMDQQCPMNKKAVIWYDECSLRYSDANIFGSDQEAPRITLYYPVNVSNPNQLDDIIGTKIAGEMASQAASDTSGKKFVTKEMVLSSFETLYSLVQCTPDLTVAECIRCLKTGASHIPPGSIGAWVLLPSCVVRYALYPFYDNFTTPPYPIPPTLQPLMPSTPSGSSTTTAGTLTGKGKKRSSSAKMIVRIALPVTLVALLLAAAGVYFFLTTKRPGTCRKIQIPAKKPLAAADVEICNNDITTMESLQYDLNLIQAATSNFSDANKLGEGGFGAVYRGKLPNGKEIAVKRLSKNSSQGFTEFKNEVVLVATLQHRNLVRLLGFCMSKKEKLLVYEFVPNRSLDYFFSDPEKQAQLDWTIRYKIIQGIARGILYLHEDSRLKIVHRDIKASNILLDTDMTPKISDFGLAKIIAMDQSRANTMRVAGTYGYMAPEYAVEGEFSESSDVYSFGVLVLEIISGQKIQQSEYPEHLISYAWKKWKDNEALEIMEPSLKESIHSNSIGEVIKCIHLALLCVQEDAQARPSMSRVVQTLSRRLATLPPPTKPAFYAHTGTRMDTDLDTTKSGPSSVNSVTMTALGRR